jgi:hypothetical protein
MRRLQPYTTAIYLNYRPWHIANLPKVLICTKMACICMVLEEYCPWSAPPKLRCQKTGNDIEDTKCSLVVWKYLEMANDEQRKKLVGRFGKHDPEGVAKAKGLYRALNMESVYHAYEEEQKATYDDLIAEIQPESCQELFKFLSREIYKALKVRLTCQSQTSRKYNVHAIVYFLNIIRMQRVTILFLRLVGVRSSAKSINQGDLLFFDNPLDHHYNRDNPLSYSLARPGRTRGGTCDY